MKYLKNQTKVDCGRIAIYNYLKLINNPIPYSKLRTLVKVRRNKGMNYKEIVKALRQFKIKSTPKWGHPNRTKNKAYIALIEFSNHFHWVLLYKTKSYNLKSTGSTVNYHKNLKSKYLNSNGYKCKIIEYIELPGI